MKDRLKVELLSLLLLIPMGGSLGCNGISTNSILTDATAVQLETSLISSMNATLTYFIYKGLNIPTSSITGISGL